MAKIHLCFLSTLVVVMMAKANCSAQSVEQGKIIIDPYYGYSFAGDKFSEWVTKANETKISGLGPLGGRVEYMVANRVGVGLIFNYNSVEVSWPARDSTGAIIDSTGTMVLTNVMINVNAHLSASNHVLDLYVGFATGTASREGTLSASTPGSSSTAIDWKDWLPFGIRATLGGRYYFTDNLGVNAELGIGSGPIISAGASVKF